MLKQLGVQTLECKAANPGLVISTMREQPKQRKQDRKSSSELVEQRRGARVYAQRAVPSIVHLGKKLEEIRWKRLAGRDSLVETCWKRSTRRGVSDDGESAGRALSPKV